MGYSRADKATIDIAVNPNSLRLYLKADDRLVADWECSPDIAEHLANRLLVAAKQAREQQTAT